MKLFVNKRLIIFSMTTPTSKLTQNIGDFRSFSFGVIFALRFMVCYLRFLKRVCLLHV